MQLISLILCWLVLCVLITYVTFQITINNTIDTPTLGINQTLIWCIIQHFLDIYTAWLNHSNSVFCLKKKEFNF